NRTDGHEAVGALDATSVGQHHLDAGLRAGHGCGTGTGEDVHALVAEHEFEHIGGVFVLARQNLLSGRHEGDLGAESAVGRSELGTGDAGADDDEVLGQRVEVVELRHDRIRSPSGWAVGSSRGWAPTDSRIVEASSVYSVPPVSTTWTWSRPARVARPWMTLTPARMRPS